jgi:hypothetical protein
MAMVHIIPTAKDREDQIIHALQKTYFLEKPIAQAVLNAYLANELRGLDQEIARVANPYRRGCRYMAWAEGLAAAQAVIFWRELRLRASAEKINSRRWYRHHKARMGEGREDQGDATGS